MQLWPHYFVTSRIQFICIQEKQAKDGAGGENGHRTKSDKEKTTIKWKREFFIIKHRTKLSSNLFFLLQGCIQYICHCGIDCKTINSLN